MTEDTAIAPIEHQGTLALRGDQSDWTPAQRAALDQIGVGDAPPGDQQVFLHVAQRTGLDPFARQIYMISRWDPQSGKNKWTIQTGIDGYRVIAERRPEYGGQLGPQWCGDDGQWRDVWTSNKPPAAARVGVIRKDWEHPAWGVAHFWEFAATKKDGNLNHMWSTKGRHQISKCAEAAALRKAFPQDFAGVYIDDEMDQASNPPQRMVIDMPHDDGAVTKEQLTKLHTVFSGGGVHDRDTRLQACCLIVGRDLQSSRDLTKEEASRLIDQLEQWATDGSLAETIAELIGQAEDGDPS